MDAKLLERPDCLWDSGDRRNAHMLDEDILRGGRAALHAINHHSIGSSLHSQSSVVVGTSGTDFHIDRHLPVGDLAQFDDLDLEIIGAGPVWVAAR